MNKKLEVYDPPMCCSTGLCGPKVDPALVQFAADLKWLEGQGIGVERHNLAQEPRAFAGNEAVKAALAESGKRCLPLVLFGGAEVSRGRYPSRGEMARMAGVAVDGPELPPVLPTGCCG